MDQSPADAAAQALEESAALITLKAKINDPNTPTLELARALQNHLADHPQKQTDLAEKLGIPQRRPFLNQILRLLKLPTETQKTLEGRVLAEREVRRLQPHDNSVNTRDNNVNRGDNNVNKADNSVNTADNRDNKGDNRPKEAIYGVNLGDNRSSPGYPLIRDTVDEFIKLLTFWRHDVHLGQIVERWLMKGRQTSWVKTGLSGLALVCTLYGAYHGAGQLQEKAQNVWFGWHAPAGAGVSASGPRITRSEIIAGNRLRLRWTSSGPGMVYRVWWHTANERIVQPLGQDVATLGAILDVSPAWEKGYVTVKAIAPNGTESAASDPVAFLPSPENTMNSVEPLPIGGTDVSRSALRVPSSANAKHVPNGGLPNGGLSRPILSKEGDETRPPERPGVVPAPVDVHYELKTPDLIILRWRSVGPGYTYHVYSSAARDLTNLRKESDRPMKSNVVHWTPETGLERYWVVVTALDPEGRESAYSEPLEVVRHPEKTASGALDGAAAAVKKFLPW